MGDEQLAIHQIDIGLDAAEAMVQASNNGRLCS